LPKRTIIDAHVHLWEPRANDWYPDLSRFADRSGRASLLDRHTFAEYLSAMPPVDLAGLVHVSATSKAGAYLDEARWLDEVIRRGAVEVAVIGSVDPMIDLSIVRVHLELQAASPHFRGVRVYDALDPDARSTRHLLAWLREHSLVFELVATPESLPRWVRVLADFDDLKVVLEHLGSPARTHDEDLASWREAMTGVASATTWSCKVSALGLLLRDHSVEGVEPWLLAAAEAWGWGRLLYGSNMPMDTVRVTHAEQFATIDDVVTKHADAAAADAFFRANAASTYAFDA